MNNCEGNFYERIKNGEEKAIDELRNKLLPQISQYIKLNSGNDDDSKDVLAQAIVILWDLIIHDRLKLNSTICNFVFGICRNIWRNELRRRKNRGEMPLKEELIGEFEDDDNFIEKELDTLAWAKKALNIKN